MVVPASVVAVDAETGNLGKSEELLRGLRAPPAARDLTATQPLGLGVGDVQLTHAFSGVVEGDPNRCALTFGDLCTGHIRHKHSLASH